MLSLKVKKINSVLLSLVVFFIARLLLPPTDEPDYPDRVSTLLKTSPPFFVYYQYFKPLINSVNWENLRLDLELFIVRILFTVAVVFPIYIYILSDNKESSKKNELWKNKLNVISLTLLFPGVWFNLGLFSEEAFVLMLFLTIIFIENLLLRLILFVIALSIDIGNSLVFLTFYLYYFFINYGIRKIGIKKTILLLTVYLLICNFLSMNLLKIITWLPGVLGEKASYIDYAYTEIYHINDKYLLIVRPLIAFVSMIFMLPESRLMPWLIYTICIYYLIVIGRNVLFARDLNVKVVASFIASIVLVFSLPMILPGYSYGKYYIFTVPFFINASLYFYNRRKNLIFLMLCNFFIFSYLICSSI